MLRCNLSVLLAERGLKITKVARDTGISRTTLTALAYNYSQGIQFETLDTLCLYLKITPEELFPFVPIGLNMDVLINGDFFKVNFKISEHLKEKSYSINGDFIKKIDADGKLTYLEIAIDNDITEENSELYEHIKTLPKPFIRDIEDKIIANVLDTLPKTANNFNFYGFLWPDGFYK